MAKNDGGPAFPGGDGAYGGGPNHAQGMSLRDWFAGQALIGVIGAATTTELTMKSIATAWSIADAMLAERDK